MPAVLALACYSAINKVCKNLLGLLQLTWRRSDLPTPATGLGGGLRDVVIRNEVHFWNIVSKQNTPKIW
jgi:hypothetical protein